MQDFRYTEHELRNITYILLHANFNLDFWKTLQEKMRRIGGQVVYNGNAE